MTDKIVDLSKAREQKSHERKEAKLESIKDRFARAMGMQEKPKAKLGAWKKRKKARPKPNPDGW